MQYLDVILSPYLDQLNSLSMQQVLDVNIVVVITRYVLKF